jgi:hypothetical protein
MIAKLKAALKRRNRPDGWWIDSPALGRHDNRQMGFYLRAAQLDALVDVAVAAKYVRDNLGKTNVPLVNGDNPGPAYDVLRAWGELNDPVNRLEAS